MRLSLIAVMFISLIAPQLSVSAQTKAIPFAEMKISGLLGGVENGRWITPARMKAKMQEKTEFVLVGWNGVEEGGVSWGTKKETEDVCPDFLRLGFDLESDTGIALGSGAKWDPAPRLAREIALTNAVYKKIVSDFLKTKGIARPVVKLTQAYQVDLEGDGIDEVVLTATYFKNGLSSSAAAGDYSLVLLRKIAGRTVVNYQLEGEYVTRGIEFGAPYEYRMSTIADLNGDGKMEIVIYGEYYEGASAGVVEMKGGKPVRVKELEIGCGV